VAAGGAPRYHPPMSLRIVEEPERRGVANPRIIDLITPDRERGEVVLKILEPRPWGAVDRQLHQLEDKLNAYFGYVLDGFLERQYPQYREMSVRIRLECVEEPGEAETPFLAAARRFSEAHGLRFDLEVVEDTSRWRAPWEEGGGDGEEVGGR
jgi:hypothetical protein